MKLSTYNILKNAESINKIEISGELLKKLQKTLLMILKDFSAVCDKYNFYYSLCGRTAPRAVRHHGFIPWDDDADVFMIRSDYEKFLSVFEGELGQKYYLHAPEITPELGMPITQLMLKGTILRSHTNPDCKNSGICIDIFILENAPDNKVLRNIHGLGSLVYGFCLSCARFNQNKKSLLEIYRDSHKEVLKAIKRKAAIGKLLGFYSVSTWSYKFSWWNSLCKNEQSKYIVCPTGIKHYFKEIFPRNIYCVTQEIKFEDTEFKVIKNYDWALRRLYGSYMTLPPVEKRERHFVLEIKI